VVDLMDGIEVRQRVRRICLGRSARNDSPKTGPKSVPALDITPRNTQLYPHYLAGELLILQVDTPVRGGGADMGLGNADRWQWLAMPIWALMLRLNQFLVLQMPQAQWKVL